MEEMKTEREIIELLEKLKNQRLNNGPFSERKNIALQAAIQMLKWVLEEEENPLTF
jgi:hypothetical protein